MNIGPCCWCAVVESESPNIVSNPNWNWSNSVVLSCITHFGPEKIMAGLLLARFVFLFFLLFVSYHLLSSVICAVGWEIENAADSLGQTFSNTQKFQGIAPNEWNSCWEFLAGKLVTFLRNHIDSLQTQHHHPTATTAEREKTFFFGACSHSSSISLHYSTATNTPHWMWKYTQQYYIRALNECISSQRSLYNAYM